MRRIPSLLFAAAFSLWFSFQPILLTSALAQDQSGEQEPISLEDQEPRNIAEEIDSLWDLDWIIDTERKLVLSPQDRKTIEEGRVDVRVTDYLIHLVKPIEFGGAGFKHVKAQRIIKNYDTDGRGKYDRETLDAIEEDVGIISAHNTGQAVDISEVGEITCKMVERRHLGGNKTNWQSPKQIKVAWQSRDGIARNPTPQGPSFLEISGKLGTDSLLQMLNESGEMEYLTEFAKGLRLEDVLRYVGANILLKEFGARSITSDPLADSLIRSLGAAMFEKAIPGLPNGLGIAGNNQDARIAIARAQMETLLGLPDGSLRGEGWRAILRSAGSRTLENALGLPTLFFDNNPIEKATALETVKAALGHLAKKDQAFGVMEGTIELIERKDTEGLIWAGVNVLADALRLTDQQRGLLQTATKQKQEPQIVIDGLPIDRDVPATTLKKLFMPDKASQNQALEELKDFGSKYLVEATRKGIPAEFNTLGNKVVDDVLSGKTITLGYLKENLGAGVLAQQLGIEISDVNALFEGKATEKTSRLIAEYLNTELELTETLAIQPSDIPAMFKGDGSALIERIGGAQADKVIGWNVGTGTALIQGRIKLDEALQQAMGNTITDLLGLEEGTYIPFSGNLQKNYGVALVEQRLGFTKGALNDKRTASDFSAKDLNNFFGEDEEQRRYTDILLGVPIGTTEAFVRGERSLDDLYKKTADENLLAIGVDQLWEYFSLDDAFRIKKEEAQFLLSTIRNWEDAELEDRSKALNFSVTLLGRFMDQQSNLAVDTVLSFATGGTEAGVKRLIDEGIRQFAGALGLKIENFSEGDLNTMVRNFKLAFNGDFFKSNTPTAVRERVLFFQQLAKATGIPDQYADDIKDFVEGNYRQALENWSSAMWTEFANKYLPADGKLSYEEMRNAILFNDDEGIAAAAVALYNKQTESNLTVAQFNALPASQREVYILDARRSLTQDARDATKYKISDAFLMQAGVPIPKGFSRIMFSGSDQERAEMMTSVVFTYLEPQLVRLVPGYTTGTLEKLYKGELRAEDVDRLVLSTINRLDINFGPFTSEFVQSFYLFIKNNRNQDFYTNDNYQGMWSYLDNWLGNTLSIKGLPDGFAKSLYYASQGGFSFDKSLIVDGRVLVPSLTQLGRDFLTSKITEWADKALGLPTGSVYQVYQAITGVINASRALTAAHAAAQGVNVTVQALTGITGSGDALVSSARTSLAKAQANLTVLAITIALNACEACQAFFASIDQAIQAPPGFTNAAVAGAIAMAAGLGPAGLIIAAAIYLFGTYRVDYLCPIPPNDRYANTQFDPENDRLDYDYGDYYSDPNRPIKDVPAEGENKFDWDDGVPFKNGNDPKLWMAWSRYFTGKLLEETVNYGALQEPVNKPLQVITYRQANVEFFAPRALEAFGPEEAGNDRVGMGYSQKSTKTTDWVHVSFGGFF